MLLRFTSPVMSFGYRGHKKNSVKTTKKFQFSVKTTEVKYQSFT